MQLTDAIEALLEDEKVYAGLEGVRYDAGDKSGMLQATVEFALQHETLGAKFREYLKSLSL